MSSAWCSARRAVGCEAGVVEEIGPVHGPHEVRPLAFEHQHEGVALGQLVGPDRAVHRMVPADPVGLERAPRRHMLTELVLQVEHHVGHGDVDVLALAGAFTVEQGEAQGGEAVHGGGVVGDGEGDRAGWPFGVAGHVHEAGRGLDDAVEAGPVGPRAGLAEGRDRHHDEIGTQAAEGVVVQVPPLQHTRPEVLDHGVAVGYEVLDDAAAARRVPVDAHALLAPIVLDEHGAAAVDDPGQDAARVAGRGQFHLDDLGAELGQHPGDARPGEVLPEVEHPVPGQHRRGGHVFPLRCRPRRDDHPRVQHLERSRRAGRLCRWWPRWPQVPGVGAEALVGRGGGEVPPKGVAGLGQRRCRRRFAVDSLRSRFVVAGDSLSIRCGRDSLSWAIRCRFAAVEIRRRRRFAVDSLRPGCPVQRLAGGPTIAPADESVRRTDVASLRRHCAACLVWPDRPSGKAGSVESAVREGRIRRIATTSNRSDVESQRRRIATTSADPSNRRRIGAEPR